MAGIETSMFKEPEMKKEIEYSKNSKEIVIAIAS